MQGRIGRIIVMGGIALGLLAAGGSRAAAEEADATRLARENGELRAQLAAREAALALALTNAPAEIRLRTALLELQQAFERFARERGDWSRQANAMRARLEAAEAGRRQADQTWTAALQAARGAQQRFQERLEAAERRLREVEQERDTAQRQARDAERWRAEKDALSDRLLARERELDALQADLRQARTEAREAPRSAPDDAARQALQTALDAGQWEAAAQASETLLNKNPRDRDARRGLAAAHLGAGDVRGALEILESLIREDDRQPDALLLSARAWSAAGNLDLAAERYARAAELLPRARRAAELPVILKELGQTEYELGRLKDAERRFREVIRARPDDAEAHFNLAAVLLSQPNPSKDEAQKAYARALELGEPRDEELEKRLR